jgi:hypothetical protein
LPDFTHPVPHLEVALTHEVLDRLLASLVLLGRISMIAAVSSEVLMPPRVVFLDLLDTRGAAFSDLVDVGSHH